ncbi:hypothetical protein INT48_002076, partial [Thamnidium elegans]
MPELTEEQIETVKQLLHRVSVLEENSLPKLETQVISLNDLISTLARRIHPLEISTPSIINSCQQQVSDLGSEIHSYIAENCQLKTQMVQQNIAVRIKAPAPSTGQASYVDYFFIQLSVVFAADEARFTSDEKKILFTIGCLSAAIRALRQIGSATKYSTEFRRISMMLNWNNDALDELARLEPITDLNQIIAKTIDIDNRLFARLQQKNTTFSRNTQPRQPVTTRPGPTPMELNYVSQPSYEIQNIQHAPAFNNNNLNQPLWRNRCTQNNIM